METNTKSGIFSVRPMKETDIDSVVAIENANFSIPWSAASFLDACNQEYNVYLVCEMDGEIVGYCGMWTVMGEGNITNMAVDEKYRKCGIGSALMNAMELMGQKMDVSIIFLEVRDSNIAAQKLYEKMGYREIGRRKRFYERPVEDALVMSKIYRAE